MTASYSFKQVRRGDRFERTFRFKDGAGALSDVSALAFRFLVATGRDIVLDVGLGDGLSFASASELTLSLTPAQTLRLSAGAVQRFELRAADAAVLVGTIEAIDGLGTLL